MFAGLSVPSCRAAGIHWLRHTCSRRKNECQTTGIDSWLRCLESEIKIISTCLALHGSLQVRCNTTNEHTHTHTSLTVFSSTQRVHIHYSSRFVFVPLCLHCARNTVGVSGLQHTTSRFCGVNSVDKGREELWCTTQYYSRGEVLQLSPKPGSYLLAAVASQYVHRYE